MKMLNGIGPTIDLVPLIIIFCAWHFNQFSVRLTVHLSCNHLVNEDAMMTALKALLKQDD